MGKFSDITNQRFSKLVAIRPDGAYRGSIMWLCRCDCGKEVVVRGFSLRLGKTKSCGCLHPLGRWERDHRRVRHGMTNTPEYIAYRDAMNRCRKTWRKDYPRYGGRGIEFRFDSFNQFYAEVGPRPAGMTLDRINNNGHYEPGNVRWATPTQQRVNQRPANRHLKAHSGWTAVRAELKKLRADLAALTPDGKHKPALEQLKAKLAALESAIKPTGMEATCEG